GYLDAGPADRFLQDRGREELGRGVDQRTLERRPDGGPDCADDDGLRHVINLRWGYKSGLKRKSYQLPLHRPYRASTCTSVGCPGATVRLGTPLCLAPKAGAGDERGVYLATARRTGRSANARRRRQRC